MNLTGQACGCVWKRQNLKNKIYREREKKGGLKRKSFFFFYFFISLHVGYNAFCDGCALIIIFVCVVVWDIMIMTYEQRKTMCVRSSLLVGLHFFFFFFLVLDFFFFRFSTFFKRFKHFRKNFFAIVLILY